MDKNTPAAKGVRTAVQAVVGALVGLVLVVWAVPGVPEAVVEYLKGNLVPVLLTVGIPSGIVAWVQNRLGK